MKRTPSLATAMLGFSAGAVGLAAAFVLAMATAITRSDSPRGTPNATDYQLGASALLLLIAGFFVAVVAARRSMLPTPSTRIAFITGLVGTTLLLSVMMLVGEPLRMRGPLVVALVAGIVSAAGAMRMGALQAEPSATM